MKTQNNGNKAVKDLFLSKNEVALTDELIEKLVQEKKWGDAESLKRLAKSGAKWNTVRNSVVFSY